MQEPEFLGYFGQLEVKLSQTNQQNAYQLKKAASNIVNTLLALTTVVGRRRASSVDEKNEEKKTKSQNLQEKYLKGDLGDGMGADLNYTIKRLIRGLTSENHATKKGYFLASV